MTTFLLIVMALLLIAALERTHRRQPPHAPGLHGADDRDWARIKLDLLALDDEAGPFARRSLAIKGTGQMNAPVLRHTTKPARQHWNPNHRNGPRSA